MTSLPNDAKIVQVVLQIIISTLPQILSALRNKDMHLAEKIFHQMVPKLANAILQPLILQVADEQFDDDVKVMRSAGGRKIVCRMCSIVICTGLEFSAPSAYAKQVPSDWKGSRHSFERKYKMTGSASPWLADHLSFLSTITPSYELANQQVKRMGIDVSTFYQRKITNAFAEVCREKGDTKLMLKPGENVVGKKVVLGVDGGRTLTRVNKEQRNLEGNLCFDGQWREPTSFVIDILDEHGNSDRFELPIYGTRFNKAELLNEIKSVLSTLQIEKADKVVLVADGAPWIWENLPQLLLDLGVEKDNMVQVLDYFHASGHLCELHKMLPKKLGKNVLANKLVTYKDWLWAGKSEKIIEDFKKHCPTPSDAANTKMNYLLKHVGRTQYADYKALKLICGSGVIESAMRRVINQRYKSNATFWNEKTVERLFFLRGALVSKRWNNVISNLFAA
jgi:hypothetical protein